LRPDRRNAFRRPEMALSFVNDDLIYQLPGVCRTSDPVRPDAFQAAGAPYQRHGRCSLGGPPPRFTGTEELPDQPFDGYPIGPLRATGCNGEREEMRLFTTGTRDSDWIEAVRSLWCKCMHEAAMWPIHGWYRCRTCHRRHPVPWASRNHHLPPPVQRGVWSNHVVPEVPK